MELKISEDPIARMQLGYVENKVSSALGKMNELGSVRRVENGDKAQEKVHA